MTLPRHLTHHNAHPSRAVRNGDGNEFGGKKEASKMASRFSFRCLLPNRGFGPDHNRTRSRSFILAHASTTHAMGMTRRTPAKPAKEAKKASKQTKTLAKDSKVVRQKVVRQKDPVGFMVRYLFVLFIVLGVTRAAFGPFPLEKRMWAKRADFLEKRAEFRAQQKVREEEMKQTLPLIFAAGEGDLPEVQRLLAEGVDINQVTLAGESVLHVSGIKGNPEVVDALIKAGADVNARTRGGTYLKMTPLHWMVYGRHLSGMRLLLENGADVNAKNTKGETCADIAEGFGPSGKHEMEMLLEYDGKPGRFVPGDVPEDDVADDEIPHELSSSDDASHPSPDVDLDALRDITNPKPQPAKIPEKAFEQVKAASNEKIQLDGEDGVTDAQKAKRERAQILMKRFQEQALELEKLHNQVKASEPGEL